MARLKTPAERASRLTQIATSYNAILHGPNAPFTRPSQPPTPSVSTEDERIADAVLAQLRHEVDQIQGSTRGFKKVFSKPSKSAPTYKDIYAALLRVIEEGGPTGSVVVLLRRFAAIEGDINVAKRASSGIVGIRSSPVQRGNIIQTAVRTKQNQFVQLLAPLADQESLDEGLGIALCAKDLENTTTLLQYGANLANYQAILYDAVEAGDVAMIGTLLRAPAKVSKACISENLLPATIRKDLTVVKLLLCAGAETNYNTAIAFHKGVEMGQIGIVAAMLMAKNPPLGISVDAAIGNLHNRPGTLFNASSEMLETLLCGKPEGNGASHCLFRATDTKDVAMIQLLLSHGADIHYQQGIALRHAVEQNHTDLVATLLEDQILHPRLASALMNHIPRRIPPADRLFMATELIPHGAFGPEASKLLITAAEQEDIATVCLLVSSNNHKGLPICSVDFDSAKSLCVAVSKNNLDMLRWLVQKGKPTNSSLSKALGAIPDNLSLNHRLPILKILLEAGAVGPEVDAALHSSLKDQPESIELIELLVQSGAVVTDATLATGVRLSSPSTLKTLLTGKVPPRSRLSAIPHAMKLRDHSLRYDIMKELLGPSGIEVNKALCDAVREGPNSFLLVELLLPYADVSDFGGKALCSAVEQSYLDGIDLLLTAKPSESAISAAFSGALKLVDLEKRCAVIDKLLQVEVPCEALSDGLIAAVNLSDMHLANLLLRFGASVNHNSGQAVVCAASAGQSELLSLLVDGTRYLKPTLSTLTNGFFASLTLKDTDMERFHAMVEILLRAGTQGEIVDATLMAAVKEGHTGLKLIGMLCHYGASVEWKDGAAIKFATQFAFFEALAILVKLGPSQKVLSQAYAIARSLPKPHMYKALEILLEAGKAIDSQVHETLLEATKEMPADRELIQILITHHCFDNGQAMIHAGRMLDLGTLLLLIASRKAEPFVTPCFNTLVEVDDLWQSSEGLAVLELLLNTGAKGHGLGYGLCRAVRESTMFQSTALKNFLDLLLSSGADVNHEMGFALQHACRDKDLNLIVKLIPGANVNTKAMAIPHLFNNESNIDLQELPQVVLKSLIAFKDSIKESDKEFFANFHHPTFDFNAVLFTSLRRFQNNTDILRELLTIGYDPNQRTPYQLDPVVGAEPCSLLCWASAQPERTVSNVILCNLIEAGADVNFTSQTLMTPLEFCIQNDRAEVVSKLVSQGAKISSPDQHGVTPLALASRRGNPAILSILLEREPDPNDGSLHDAACALRCDIMRLLVKHGHSTDYPSERHDGRTALAELCLNAVRYDPKPGQLEEAISYLLEINNNTARTKCISADKSERSVFHFALDSVNPVMILSALLKRLWQLINEDTFLFQDQTYTYSLTKYVEKDLFKGPQGQKSELLRLLNIKQAKDRFWATDIDAEQPDDLVNPPADIKEEANRQKQQKRQMTEQRQQARDRLAIKRLTTLQEIEILDMKNKAEIQRWQERARVDSQLLAVHSRNQNALENENENQRQERLDQRQSREREHIQALQDISISGERQRAQEILTSTESHQRLQLGFIEQRNMKNHDGLRQRLTLEGSFKLEEEKLEKRRSERIAANIQYQKELVDSQDKLMSNPNMRRWTSSDPATSTHGLIGPLPMDYSSPGPIHDQNVLTDESVAEILNELNIKPRKELPPP
ncbi:hypothetical protein HYFRA_00004669 [Hymenoscyphus fraxineus]|uniref:Ankyrin repeat containing protein n=1 Tax=Hymenoscyphus fraxineus TaxID=746836 RepID=A0A9N9KWH6_9HELO|nr:hypothetical protein HYFRA_00004669 [Hymenoscyphus fraxineus]